MKLVEILARELKEWPVGIEWIRQIGSGNVVLSNGIHSREVFQLGQDQKHAEVTRAQWEAERARIIEKSSRFTEEDKANIERARIATNQQATQEAREIARTGRMTSEEQELADIACGKRSKEDQEQIKEVTSSVSVGYTLQRDYEAEDAMQYDQELWDKVAISAIDSILQKEYAKGVEYKLIASECFEFADMFMAERAKRMKG